LQDLNDNESNIECELIVLDNIVCDALHEK